MGLIFMRIWRVVFLNSGLKRGVVSYWGFCCSSKLPTSERADRSVEASSAKGL